ncbi:GtrA family protein [Entomobacter blattae]|uniref:GtrA-like protein n=1 Tax=Entomobacter blattae TaxID=2762277 RepID=A0A7H1NUV4_9PROT|nr:GtrA family protein [Entomobacter blattae]QNT79564.1 GtrA-like protein [Entomobacter blattae]
MLYKNLKPLLNRHKNFLKFASIGSLGFLCDTASVYALKGLLGLYPATFLAYFIAATATWYFNRCWTYSHIIHKHSIIVQWFRFLVANSVGLALNRTTVVLLYSLSFFHTYPVVALAFGSVAGLFANFNFSSKLVFQSHEKASSPSSEINAIPTNTPSDPFL